jgi:hypothetical protein
MLPVRLSLSIRNSCPQAKDSRYDHGPFGSLEHQIQNRRRHLMVEVESTKSQAH